MIQPGDMFVRTVTTQTPASATSIVVIEAVRQGSVGYTKWKCYHIGSGNFIHLEDYYIDGHYRKVA